MNWLLLVVLILTLCFGGVLLFGAPYLPTLSPQVSAALELAELSAGQTLLELGCGDGKVLVAAAKQGVTVIGYELNPILALVAWLRTRRYNDQVTVICGDFWNIDWPATDVIFTFLLPRYMEKLNKKIIQYNYKPVRLVSFAFKIPKKRITREQAGVYQYDYR